MAINLDTFVSLYRLATGGTALREAFPEDTLFLAMRRRGMIDGHEGASAPSDTSKLWADTTVTTAPAVWKYHDGTAWVTTLGTDAVARHVVRYGRKYEIDVRAFGAIANTGADQTAALTAAFAASASTGIEVIVGRRGDVYTIDNHVPVPAGASIRGHGTILRTRANIGSRGQTGLLLGEGVGFTIRDVTLKGTREASTTIDFTGGAILHNDDVVGFNGSETGIIYTRREVSDVLIENVTVENWDGNGIYLVSSKDVRIARCKVKNTGYRGIGLFNTQEANVEENVVDTVGSANYSSVVYGIVTARTRQAFLTPTGGSSTAYPYSLTDVPDCTRIAFANNTVRNIPSYVAYDQHGGNNIQWINNTADNVAGFLNIEHADGTTPVAPNGVIISGNRAVAASGAGPAIYCEGGFGALQANIQINDNHFFGFGGPNSLISTAVAATIYVRRCSGINITNNVIEAGRGAGIQLNDEVIGAIVKGNICQDMTGVTISSTTWFSAIAVGQSTVGAVIDGNYLISSAGATAVVEYKGGAYPSGAYKLELGKNHASLLTVPETNVAAAQYANGGATKHLNALAWIRWTSTGVLLATSDPTVTVVRTGGQAVGVWTVAIPEILIGQKAAGVAFAQGEGATAGSARVAQTYTGGTGLSIQVSTVNTSNALTDMTTSLVVFAR